MMVGLVGEEGKLEWGLRVFETRHGQKMKWNKQKYKYYSENVEERDESIQRNSNSYTLIRKLLNRVNVRRGEGKKELAGKGGWEVGLCCAVMHSRLKAGGFFFLVVPSTGKQWWSLTSLFVHLGPVMLSYAHIYRGLSPVCYRRCW